MPRDESKMNSQDPRAKSEGGQARQQSDEATPGLGENQAGFLREKDRQAGDSTGTTPAPGQGSNTTGG